MALAFKPGNFEFTLKEDRDKSADDLSRTTVLCGTLDEHEQAQIDDALEFSEGEIGALAKMLGVKPEAKGKKGKGSFRVNTRAGTRTLCILRVGLKGFIRGPLGADGQPTAFEKPEADGMCNWKNIRALQPKHRSEIAAAIESGNQITEDEAKN